MRPPPALADAWSTLRREAARLGAELRRADRFSRMRAAVVGGWAVASVLTLFLACPSAGPGNSLGAEARMLGDSFVGGAQVMVRNDSGEVWTDVVLTLDGDWRYRHPTLRPRDELVVPVARFRRGAEEAPAGLRPQRLAVECGQGSSAFELR